MLANFLIGLREGLEAALVVGILIAYLKKINQGDKTRSIWQGVFAAIALSAALGSFFTISSIHLEGDSEPLVAGILSFTAAALITWMVVWLGKNARFLKAELEGSIDRALATGAGSLFALAFFAVGREGLETAIFIWNGAMASQDAALTVIGTFLGLAVSVIAGWLLYKGALKLNLAKFFRYSGIALIVVAAGMFSYGIHEFQEFGILPGPDAFAWDITSWMPKESFVASLLGGTIGFDTTTSWLQLFAWAAYLGLTIAAYLSKPAKAKTPLNA